MANLILYAGAVAQGSSDSALAARHHKYLMLTLFTGADVQFFPAAGGLLSVLFPYTVADASGSATSAVFKGEKNDIYASPKYYLLPFALEKGWRHHLVHFGFTDVLVQGCRSSGFHGWIGYGRMWYTRRYAIRLSIDMAYTIDPQDGNYDLLGAIDNRDKTIYLLGQTIDSTFTVPARKNQSAQTYAANTLNVSYSQEEWSLLPKLSILSNPFSRHFAYELSVGFNFPLREMGNLNFMQVAADGTTQEGGTANIINNSISASYNRRPVNHALYRFGGVYLGLVFELMGFKEK